MPLSATIETAKELAQGYQPLLLCEMTFGDGSVLRISTHPLSAAEGGYQYGGVNYLARIADQDIEQLAAKTETGIIMPPAVTLHLYDADKFLWTNYEKASGKGFKGAELLMRLVFWEADTSNYSSNARIVFRGRCDQPTIDDDSLTVRASSLQRMTRDLFPILRVQPRCSWVFPATKSQRIAGALNEDSEFFECGYSPDVTDSDGAGGTAAARGNYVSGSTPYTSCDYTFESCIARLGNSHTPPFSSGNYPAIQKDSSGRKTGRFSGVRWMPPTDWRGREYTSGSQQSGTNAENNSRYGKRVPMVYGTTWVNGVVMQSLGDPNSTRGEAILCLGQVSDILILTVNDERLSPSSDVTGTYPYIVPDTLMRYDIINDGRRDGTVNGDAIFDYNGDPYGSTCVVEWVVPSKVAGSGNKPNVRALVRGPKLRVYTDATTFSKAYTENPVWQVLDILTWSSWQYSDIDLASFVAAAAVCDATVTYTDLTGSSQSHPRFSSSFVLDNPQSAGRIIDGLLRSFNGGLVHDPATGKLQLFIDGPLASQQPSAVSGSNYNTAISAKTYANATANGYAAYSFDETNIVADSFRQVAGAGALPANRITVPLIDSDRDRVESSFTRVDSEDIARAGQESATNLDVVGLQNFDQAQRIVSLYQARQLRGNSQADTRGTLRYEFQSTFRVAHLRLGHIVRLSWQAYGISNQLFRVEAIKPSANYETATVRIAWHEDAWHVDGYGQSADNQNADGGRRRQPRAPYPWCPNLQTPIASDPIRDPSDKSFGARQLYGTAADGTAIAQLEISGAAPVSDVSSVVRPPLVLSQGTTASSGGSLSGTRVYYMAVCAKDSAGKLSPPSDPVTAVAVNTSGSSHTISMSIVQWDPATAGFSLFVGTSPGKLTWQADDGAAEITESGATPATITFEGPFKVSSYGPPDVEFDRVRVRSKILVHAGVFAGAVSNVAGSVVTIPGMSWGSTPANHVVSFLADGNTALYVPIADYTITAYSSDTITLSPSPSAVSIGDVLVVRSRPTVGSDGSGAYVEDALWVNSGGSGLTANAEVGNVLRVLAGTGAGYSYRIKSNTSTRIYIDGSWVVTPDSTSIVIVESPEWLFQVDSAPAPNSDPASQLTIKADINNYSGQSLLVKANTVDSDDGESIETFDCIREIYVFGQAGSIGGGAPAPDVQTYSTVTVADGLNAAYWKISGTVTWPSATHADVDSYEIILEGPKQGSTFPTPIAFSGRLSKSSASATISYASDGTWQRPPDSDAVFRLSVVSYNVDGVPTAPAGHSAEFTVAYYSASGTTPASPTQPGTSDWSVAVTLYASDVVGKQFGLVRITCTTLSAATSWVQAWIYEGASPPADMSLWKDVAAAAKASSGNTIIEFWMDRRKVPVTYQLCVTSSNATFTQFPTATSDVKSFTITAVSTAAAVTGPAVTAHYDESTGVGMGWYEFSITGPSAAADPLRTEIRWEGRFNNSTWTSPTAWDIVASLPSDELTHTQTKNSWKWPEAAEYREFRVGSINASGDANWYSSLIQVTLSPGGGIKANFLNISTLGRGITVKGGKLVSTADDFDNLILNPSFDLDDVGSTTPREWTISGGSVQVVAGFGSNLLKFPTEGPKAYQSIPVKEGDPLWARAIFYSPAGADGAAYLQCKFYDATDTFISEAPFPSLAPTGGTLQEISITATAPPNAFYAQIVCLPGGGYTTGASAAWYLDYVQARRGVVGGQLSDGLMSLPRLYDSTYRPMGIGSVLPTLPSTYYPEGSLFINTSNKVVYKVKSGAWVNAVAAAEVGSGTLPAGVTYTGTLVAEQVVTGVFGAGVAYVGTLSATQVTSGGFSGRTLSLTLNGITTTINNELTPDAYMYGGVQVKGASGYPFTALSTDRLRIYDGSGATVLAGVASGSATLQVSGGGRSVFIISNAGISEIVMDSMHVLTSQHPAHQKAASPGSPPNPFLGTLPECIAFVNSLYNQLQSAGMIY